MKAADTIELSAAVCDLQAARIQAVHRRVHAFLGLMLAIAVGMVGAWALVTFGTPCEGASLCLFTAVPTRRSWLQRLMLNLQSWRLQIQIRRAQQDLNWQYESLEIARWECNCLPQQMAVTRAHIDSLSMQLDMLGTPLGH